MISRPKSHTNVAVVGARPDDYLGLVDELAGEGVSLDVFNSARAALRSSTTAAPDLWILNMNLPDMSGTDLLSMLRWRFPGVPVFLVSDDYRQEDEISARSSGAEMYLCKPLCGEWLTEATAAAH